MLARLFTPGHGTRAQTLLGLWLSVAFALIYGCLAMKKGFAADYVVQDDARHYLFWMARFRDAGAFPHDLIADYLQAIAPVGYKLLFRLASYGHLPLDWFAKVLPTLLGMVAAGYFYCLTLVIFPVPMTGLMASVMLSQHLWCTDDLVSASPRAFIYPLLIPLLYYFVRRQWAISLVFSGLLALFYPPVALVAMGLYAAHAVDWLALKDKWYCPWVTIHRGRGRVAIAAFSITALCILPTYLLAQGYGPVATMAQAHTLPEFQPSGRHSFFREGLSRYWLILYGGHGAILKRTIFTPVSLVGAMFLLPAKWRGPKVFPGLRAMCPQIHVFTTLTCVSLLWFMAAYGLAFRLHMPGRYTSHCILLAMPLLAAIAWTLILERLCRVTRLSGVGGRLVASMVVLLMLGPLFFYYPLLLNKFPKTLYVTGREAPIYEYLQTQPLDTLVASIDFESDNIPTFGQRSTLVAAEYATPFHLGYYRQIRQRAADLLTAHYTADADVLGTFVDDYGIDFWLVNKAAFGPNYLAHHRYWANNYQPLTQSVVDSLATGSPSTLQTHIDRCTVVETEGFWLLSAICTLD